jgi:hypothetical protein
VEESSAGTTGSSEGATERDRALLRHGTVRDAGPLRARPPMRRRAFLHAAAAPAAGPLVPRFARAHQAKLEPHQRARTDWRQAAGEGITVVVIPAGYFDNLIAVTPTFEDLTGVKVRSHKILPRQIRQAAMQDFAAKTATYATSGTDQMYYPFTRRTKPTRRRLRAALRAVLRPGRDGGTERGQDRGDRPDGRPRGDGRRAGAPAAPGRGHPPRRGAHFALRVTSSYQPQYLGAGVCTPCRPRISRRSTS